MKWLTILVAIPLISMIAGTLRSAPTFEFAQGVIVDPRRAAVYIMNSEDGIDAVDLTSGKVMATSHRGAKPLFIYDDALLAQADVKDRGGLLSLVGLDWKNLQPRFEVEVPLPENVQASIDDSLGGSFYVSAHTDNREIVVQWRSVQHRISGVPTSEPAQITTGYVLIDAKSGRVLTSAIGEGPGLGGGRAKMPAVVQRPLDSRTLGSQLCQVDDLTVAIQYVPDKIGNRVLLRRWNKDSGQELPKIELFGSELIFRNFSADCRYLLASKAKDGWLWSILSTTTGDRVAEVHRSSPGSQFFVWKGRLIYEEPAEGMPTAGQMTILRPRRLVAVDLDTGSELWAHPIRETKYLGPYPGNPRTFR